MLVGFGPPFLGEDAGGEGEESAGGESVADPEGERSGGGGEELFGVPGHSEGEESEDDGGVAQEGWQLGVTAGHGAGLGLGLGGGWWAFRVGDVDFIGPEFGGTREGGAG